MLAYIKAGTGSFGLDTTETLEINGTRQRVRLCAARGGLPPLLVVQAGPGLPLLNEAGKFQQRLQLERDFTVAYWDQRGCGNAAAREARSVSLETQVDDLSAVIRWLAERTWQQVLVLGISLGATIALKAAARDASQIKGLVSVSIDTDTSASDLAASDFVREAAARDRNPKLARSVEKLGPPPYLTPEPLQLRARLLSDLGAIEHGKRFGELLRGLLGSLIGTYGWLGAGAALRNMIVIQRKMLPGLATLNLFESWPQPAVPVHYIFGSLDPLAPQSLVQKLSGVVAPGDSILSVPNAGHMVHFDQPAVVRVVIAQAAGG